jgi:RNA polymerase sigma-70 factor (ECF subfamily)
VRSAGRERARGAAYEDEREAPVDAAPEDKIDLERAMDGLPPDQRACVALCLAADFSHAEAAEALDMPLGTVKSHVTRGRARLLQALGVCDDASR